MGMWSTWFGFSNYNGDIADSGGDGHPLKELYPLLLDEDAFIKVDVASVYTKILTDVFERTQGIEDKYKPTLFDNCLKSEKSKGLISLLSSAMAEKKELYLIFEKELPIVREATSLEKQQMEADYKKGNQKPGQAFISFKDYSRTDMLMIYSAFEFCALGSLNKSMHLAMAIQIKIAELRKSVSLLDSKTAKDQALEMAQALELGLAVILDAGDSIETSKIDIEPAKEALLFLNQKRAFYTGMSAAYISGEQTGGLGTTGENDTKANEQGFKNYFESIIKPVCKALFEKEVTYKSQDFRQITQGLDALMKFQLLHDESLLSLDAQRLIVNGLLNLSPEENKVSDPVEPEPVDTITDGKPLPGQAPEDDETP